MFSFTLNNEDFPIGGLGKIENFKCPNRKCGHQAIVLIGVADKDKRDDVKKIEDEMNEQIKERAGIQ